MSWRTAPKPNPRRPPWLLVPLLRTFTHEIYKVHNVKVSHPPDHLVFHPDFDPDVVIKPILSTYYSQFFGLFRRGDNGKYREREVRIWMAFHAALLKVWEGGDVEEVVEGFWECVEMYFDVTKDAALNRAPVA
ncbi:hypothetical protein TWF481_001324 [Arthrobotrys musiformis]|uniref:Globin family profile domain-containing protein n=1 Tax=Arthrobotrys musiformis TaxID=47236 RepID=A0AAV9WQG7_9PEZI